MTRKERKAIKNREKEYEVEMENKFKNLDSLSLEELTEVNNYKKDKHTKQRVKVQEFKRLSVMMSLLVIAGTVGFILLTAMFPMAAIGLVAWLALTGGATFLHMNKLTKDANTTFSDIQKILKRKYLLEPITGYLKRNTLSAEDLNVINVEVSHGNNNPTLIAAMLEQAEKNRIDSDIRKSLLRQKEERDKKRTGPYMDPEDAAAEEKRAKQYTTNAGSNI